MNVYFEDVVYEKLRDFYIAAMQNHITLSRETVKRKIWRMYNELQILGKFQGFRKARLKQQWIGQGWHEFSCEGFIFAYEVCVDPETEEQCVWVRDVEHGSLYK